MNSVKHRLTKNTLFILLLLFLIFPVLPPPPLHHAFFICILSTLFSPLSLLEAGMFPFFHFPLKLTQEPQASSNGWYVSNSQYLKCSCISARVCWIYNHTWLSKARRTLEHLAELPTSRARLLSHYLTAQLTADSEESAPGITIKETVLSILIRKRIRRSKQSRLSNDVD